MKVLLVTKSLEKGGSASGASNLFLALRSAGADVVALDAYSSRKTMLVRAGRLAERVFERLFFDAQTHCLRVAPPVFDLPRLVQMYRPDVIQLCDVSGNVIRFSDLPKVPGPVVHRMSDFWPYHGPDHYQDSDDRRHPIARWLMRKTIFSGTPVPDMRVAPSHWLAARLHAQKPATVILNAQPAVDLPAPKALADGTLRFGFVSNTILEPRKGFHTLRARLEYLASRGQAVSLHLFGRLSGRNMPEFKGVDVIAHGPFSRRDVAKVYSEFDILLCPSVRDNSPNVLCEAMAHGCPAIAQKGTGMDSYLTPKAGFLLDFQSEAPEMLEEFAQASNQIRENFATMSREAADHTRRILAPERIGNQYLDLYRKLLEQRQKKEPER